MAITRGAISITMDTTNQQVVAAQAGKKIKVLSMVLTLDAAGTVTVKSGTTSLSGAMAIASNGNINFQFSNIPHYETEAGEALKIAGTNTRVLSGSYVADIE